MTSSLAGYSSVTCICHLVIPVDYLSSMCCLPVIHLSFTSNVPDIQSGILQSSVSSTCHPPVVFLTSSQEYYSHTTCRNTTCHHLSSTCHLLVVYLSSTCGLPVIYILCIMYLLSTFLYLSSTCSVPVIYLLSTCHLTVIYCSYHLPVYLLSACHPYFNDFCITSSARLTIVPVVPWYGPPPPSEGPRPTANILPRCFGE